MKIEFYIAPI